MQPRGDVDIIAQDIASTGQNLPDMDADAEMHTSALGHRLIDRSDLLLDQQCTLDGIRCAGKFGENTVAGGVGYSPAMISDHPIGDFAMRCQEMNRSGLIKIH